mmetsp:Transcript_10306/g.31518  ORF Transcript_10306/g.31518 Transcript_10306/m.31518 type:complete len:122 (-) Transcript_10306:367-732(-)|eukprot:CAMPEP_0198732126 /NCGR_PEP_ID=MMETSP1475-20131203/33996_1 /TAXON_ID= ORGANISM="Unidentified sp., Strain CCMP1999" /NCGR_SAMPLE_ID=MMETSP1475 /ASSEMBLY_ACC=CAM_ASM_001111 /LENGTH=121 /DNA_ID=CAMNT_0044495177 /DNA_START=56 /DNA_END=421 /DNA_ORIENTATION=+
MCKWELFRLCALRDEEGVRIACENGGEVNFVNYDGRTALHVAATDGLEQIARILLRFGADPRIQDRYGATPLDCAKRSGNYSVVALLSRYGVPVEHELIGGIMKRGHCKWVSLHNLATMCE